MISLFTLKEKKALRVIVFLTIIMRLALMFRSEERIFTRPFNEDSFYLFSTAEHFAKGNGFSVDGAQPTNGVQPLIIFFYAPLFLIAGFNKLLVLKLAFIWVALFDALSVFLLAVLMKKLSISREKNDDPLWKSPPMIAAALWAFLYPIYIHTACGLETGLYSMLLLLTLVKYTDILKSQKNREHVGVIEYIGLGIVLGFTVLSRIDAAIFVALIAAYEIWKHRIEGVKNAFIIGITALILSSPWWWYNVSVFGHILPQSGFAESLINETSRNLWQALTVIADSLSIFFFLPKAVDVSHEISLVWFIVVIGGIFFIVKYSNAFHSCKNSYNLSPVVPLAATCAVFFIYYVFFFSAPHFIPRYFQPLRIVAIIMGSMLLPTIIQWALQSKAKKTVLILFCSIVFLFSFLRYGYFFTTTDYSDLYKAGKWAETVAPKQVGMYQSGTAGFIASNVTNLDGKVNIEALKARQGDDIGKYVAEKQFDYIADWPDMVNEILHSAKRYGLEYVFVDSLRRVHIYKRVTSIK